ncbi:hypothetical protein P2318_03135 [Myxococcaceae bacterium GXIMD 01537]
MRRTWVGSGLVLALTGCAAGSDAFKPNPNKEDPLVGGVPLIKAPGQDRCSGLGKSGVRPGCDEARYLGTLYTRRLSVADDVCLDGGFGEEVGAACRARAAVIDTAPNRVKLEIRSAKPDSRWFNSEGRTAWYEEGALVDLYLAERGY